MDRTYDVAIVGLGPVGVTAANLCARQGLKTLVIERDSAPYTMPRAIHFDSEIMRIFQSIGAADDVAIICRPLGGSVYLGVDGKPIRSLHTPDTVRQVGWPASHLFYQPKLEEVLRAHLAARKTVDLHLKTSCDNISQDGDKVTLGLFNIENGIHWTAEASFVLACDGARSFVRKSLSIPLEDLKFEEAWLVVDAMVNGSMLWPEQYDIPAPVRAGQFSLMVCDPSRPSTVIPGPGQHRRWEFMLKPDETPDDMDEQKVRQLLGAWVKVADVEIVRAAVYQFHGLIAESWRSDRIFLLGDAAHQTPPFYGQGMCHGLRDTANLIWKLALVLNNKCNHTILDSYEIERRPHVRAIIDGSVKAGAAICIQDRERAIARDKEFRNAEAVRKTHVAMTDIVPPLKSGLLSNADYKIKDNPRGLHFIQPPVSDTMGKPLRLDDCLDCRPALVGYNFDPMAGMNAGQVENWRRIGGIAISIYPDREKARKAPADNAKVVIDTDGFIKKWLEQFAADILLVRPDRYVFGATKKEKCTVLIDDFFQSVGIRNAQSGQCVALEEGY